MTLWMILRIGGQDWDYAGDNPTHAGQPTRALHITPADARPLIHLLCA
jgi:hypothetical protein